MIHFSTDDQPEPSLENDIQLQLVLTKKLIAWFQFCKKYPIVHNLRNQTISKN